MNFLEWKPKIAAQIISDYPDCPISLRIGIAPGTWTNLEESVHHSPFLLGAACVGVLLQLLPSARPVLKASDAQYLYVSLSIRLGD
jgi:hypothetical protein